LDVKKRYLDTVLAQVKFTHDRADIKDELLEHILEECAYLRAKGMSPKEAEREAVRRMGDSKELGRMLNEIHNPWVGRLWLATWAAILILVWIWIYCIIEYMDIIAR